MCRLSRILAILSISLAIPAIAQAQDGGAGEVLVIVPAEAPPAPPPVVTVSEVEREEPEPARFEPGFFSIGLSGLIGIRESGRDDFAPTWTSGLDLGFRVLPFLSIGARRITYAHSSGDRMAIGGAPALELALPFFPRVQPYVQVGAAVQVRFGADQGRATGVAPFVGTGVRLFLTEWLSLAPEGAVHVPVTDGGFLLGHEVMPQGAIVLQGGVALAFHIR